MSYKHLFEKDYQKTIEKIIRVDYAGELGAIKIYRNQIKALPEHNDLEEMLDSEIIHFEYFKKISKELSVPQTLFLPIWAKLASIMGYSTAKSSYSNAMLCTQAVETVIENHYQEQINQLEDILEYHIKKDRYIVDNKEKIQEMLAKIKIFLQEEIEHKNKGEENSHMKKLPFFIISAVTKLAISLSKKF